MSQNAQQLSLTAIAELPEIAPLPEQEISTEVLVEKYAKGAETNVHDVRRRVAQAELRRATLRVGRPRAARGRGEVCFGDTHALGHSVMLNWIGTLPDAGPVLREPRAHWHDYGKEPRAGRKVGHATVRADNALELAAALERIGQALGRQDQVAPPITVLHAL